MTPRIIRSVLATLVLSLMICTPAAADQASAVSETARLAEITTGYFKAAAPPGLTVQVDRGGTTLFRMSLGLADVPDRRAPTPDSVYAIGSITKSYTALSVLQLVDSGRIGLDMTVGELLPEYQGPARGVALRHLLDHTSGIPSYTDIDALRPLLERNLWSREELVAQFAPLPLLFEPGTRWSYSNSNYYLLGLIVEHVSGEDYYSYLKRHVLAPLDLGHTYDGNDAELVGNRVQGYSATRDGLQNASPWYYLVPYSAGSLLATADDVARYRRGVFKGNVVPPSLLALVTRTDALADGTQNLYTLGGLITSDFMGHRKYSHSGEIYGFHSDHAYYPDDDLTIVVMANQKGLLPSPVSLERQLARAVLGLDAPSSRPLAQSKESLDRYAGDYEMRPFLLGPPAVRIEPDGTGLGVRLGGADAPPLPFVAVAEGRFICALDSEWTIEFAPPATDGRSPGFKMVVADGTLTAFRSTSP